MGVVLPIIGAVAGVASTAYGIINSENQNADNKQNAEKTQKAQLIQSLRSEREGLEIQRQTAEFQYKKLLDEAVRKKKVRTISVVGLGIVLFFIGVLITVKINSSEERNANSQILN